MLLSKGSMLSTRGSTGSAAVAHSSTPVAAPSALRAPACVPPVPLPARASTTANADRLSVTARSAAVGVAAPHQDSKSQEYTRLMKDAMGWEGRPFDYDYSRGLYYHEIVPGLIVGSQPRHTTDVEELKSLGVTGILSLQQDKDMHYWGVNPAEVHGACQRLGMNLIRREVKDFDPHSLRKVLPSAVRALHNELAGGGRVYVHCTAGLGRAPAVGIAYLYWFRDLQLPDAYGMLTSIRPCGPKKDAVRAATFDLLRGHQGKHPDEFNWMPQDAFAFLNPQDRANLHQTLFH